MVHITYASKQKLPPGKSHVNRILGTGYYAVILFYSEAVIETSDGMINMKPPFAVIFDKFSKQHYYAEKGSLTLEALHFDADSNSENKIFKKLVLNKPFPIENLEPVQNLMWLIASEYHSSSVHKESNINSLFKILINKISEEFKLSELKKEYGKQCGIVYVKNRIMHNPGYNWTIKKLAEECNMSESFFQITYKKLYSTTCIADVIDARLKMSKGLIENSGFSIKEISAQCGYRRPEHFSRQFKEAYGMSPAKYKKQCLAKKEKTQEI